MGYALPQTIQMTDMQCPTCGTPFAMSERIRADRQQTGAEFFCPVGHPQHYGDTTLKRTQRMLEQANAQNTRLADQVRVERDAKCRAEAERNRLRNRVQKGVCPCCNRTFQNLARHMATKHKEK
jgi:hypothetical protein